MSVSEIGIFLKRWSLSKSGWQCLNSEANSRHENKEGFFSLQVSFTRDRGPWRSPGTPHRYIWMLTQISGTTGRKAGQRGQHQANTHTDTFSLSPPDICSSSAPANQYNHNPGTGCAWQAGPRPSRDSETTSSREKSQQDFWAARTKAALNITMNAVGPYYGADETSWSERVNIFSNQNTSNLKSPMKDLGPTTECWFNW